MEKEILIVLGSPNSPLGELSNISKSRLDYCVSIYLKGKKVLCTGGWGKHFNVSKEAHAAIAKKYLVKMGVLENDFLESALSENTVDDAMKVKASLSRFSEASLTIISSDYHLERVKLIFNEVLEAFKLNYIGVKSDLEEKQLTQLLAHERKAIEQILKNGLYY